MLLSKWIDFCAGALVGAMLFMAAAPAAADPLPAGFLGKFRGSLASSVGEIEGDFNMVSSAKRGGFSMAWSPDKSAEFQPSENRNVFKAPDSGRLVDGAPAFWSRLEDGKLIVYSMRIDVHGGYDIYTFIYTPAEGGLDMIIRHLRSGSGPMESTARLKRYDG